jgi:hypothetical protein
MYFVLRNREKSKQFAEQGAAMVATTVLDIDDNRQFDTDGQNEAVFAKWKRRKNDDVKHIYLKFKELIDKGNEEKLLKKRHRDENIDNCIEVKHFVTEDAT